jgi:sulfate/thiosulfate transport system ATP-binding protein
MSIIVEKVSKQFGSFKALDDVSLKVAEGKLVALLGPSGSGKSTLLRAIAGLETPDFGSIFINGKNTSNVDIRKRNIGFVFQHYALFKHLTVRQNIAFGLEIRKTPKQQVKRKVEELLQLIQLQGLGDRYPSQLSGGQRQRVALARALCVQPQVLLLDEPFGALDAKVRKELRVWLRQLHDEVGMTTVFVTHDQEEAMEVADEIVVMNHGRIEQVGTAAEIYDRPATPFVMSFVGEVNILPATTRLFRHYARQQEHSNRLNALESSVFVRPHDLDIQTEADGESTGAIVKRVTHLGWDIQIELNIPEEHTVLVRLNREKFNLLDLEPGQQVFVKPRKTKRFEDAMLSVR